MFIEISNLPETLNIDSDSVFPLVYQGQTKKTTLNSLKEALNYFTAISYNKSTGQFTFTKVNNEDVVLSTDLNTSIKNVSLSNGILTFTQQDNSTISIDISIGDGTITKAKLAQALQNEINEKYVKPSGGIPKVDLASAVQASLDKADTAVQDVSDKEDVSNKVTEIDETSTDDEYPSAKLLYDQLAEKQEQIDGLIAENTVFKKQIPTAHISTTSIQLTDSADGMSIENVKLKGATWQEQYEGYNLWNGTRRAINGTVVDEVVETTALSYHGWLNVYSNQAISLSANQDYYLSCEIRIKSGSAEKLNYFRPTDYPADSTKVFVQNPNLSSNYQRFICKVTATTAVKVGGIGFQITDGTDAVLECKNFMISTTNVAYEPYVGRTAST